MLSAHTWVGDLIITLTSPTGTTSTLLNRIGQVHGIGHGLDFDLDDWILTSNAFRGEMSAALGHCASSMRLAATWVPSMR